MGVTTQLTYLLVWGTDLVDRARVPLPMSRRHPQKFRFRLPAGPQGRSRWRGQGGGAREWLEARGDRPGVGAYAARGAFCFGFWCSRAAPGVSRGRENVPCSRGCSGPWNICRPISLSSPSLFLSLFTLLPHDISTSQPKVF
jgi:hypothetical protein